MLARVPLMIRQVVKFGMVGVLNTAVDWAVYFLLTHGLAFFTGAPALAKAISYSCGVLNSFFWNRAWTFRSSTSARSTMLPFFLINLFGVGVNAGLMHLGLNTLHLPEIASLVLATAVTMGWNFLMSKLVVFKA